MVNISLGQELSWIFGIISNLLWLFVFIPQLYTNYKNKNANGLSLLLLFCLIFGDILSMISAISKQLNPVIIYSALYHIILDIIVICQIFYYRIKATINVETGTATEEIIDDSEQPLIEKDYEQEVETDQNNFFYLSIAELLFLILASIFTIVLSVLVSLLPDKEIMLFIADLLGWFATMIFITSRIPQILLNYNKKSTKGLSLLSFIIINIANWCFLLSILIVLYDIPNNEYLKYIKYNLQWIIGSSLTSLFDAVIFYQFYNYRPRHVFLHE